jgi:hypothetical protein
VRGKLTVEARIIMYNAPFAMLVRESIVSNPAGARNFKSIIEGWA